MRDIPGAPARAKICDARRRGRGPTRLSRGSVPSTNHEFRARLFDGTLADVAQREAAGTPDAAAVEGAATYTSPFRGDRLPGRHRPADRARWRGNADSYTAFFTECFVDEMAARAGSDALSYRMAMLGQGAAPRPLPAHCDQPCGMGRRAFGHGAGSAHSMRGSHIALVATARPATGVCRAVRTASSPSWTPGRSSIRRSHASRSRAGCSVRRRGRRDDRQ